MLMTLGSSRKANATRYGSPTIKCNQFYSVKTLSVNYTTYDVRHDRDTIDPGNHNFVMVRYLKMDLMSIHIGTRKCLGCTTPLCLQHTLVPMTDPCGMWNLYGFVGSELSRSTVLVHGTPICRWTGLLRTPMNLRSDSWTRHL